MGYFRKKTSRGGGYEIFRGAEEIASVISTGYSKNNLELPGVIKKN